jgi:hypothetical protein
VLGAASNAIEDLLPLVEKALAAIEQVQPGQAIRVSAYPHPHRLPTP